MSANQHDQSRRLSNLPFHHPTSDELDKFQEEIRNQLTAIEGYRRSNAEFCRNNAAPDFFSEWVSKVEMWTISAIVLLESILSVRASLERYELASWYRGHQSIAISLPIYARKNVIVLVDDHQGSKSNDLIEEMNAVIQHIKGGNSLQYLISGPELLPASPRAFKNCAKQAS
ncbi:hypothetical protein NHQ30_010853 [Ciborinia camelliae]|nr:hypothetical protein NHQ30_010853 [Ciborinia camelliae]